MLHMKLVEPVDDDSLMVQARRPTGISKSDRDFRLC
jgi:hypothetical protein